MIKKNKNYSMMVILVLCLLFIPSIVKSAEKGFYVDVSVSLFSNSDVDFKEAYKSSIMVPEINLGYFFTDNLYVFGGYEFYKVDGKTPEWDFTLNMDQKILSLGAGYFKEFSEKLGLSGELGLVSISYTEKLIDLELENKDSCIGFRLRTKLQYKISNLIGLYLKLGYTIAKDTIDDVENNFGGISTGVGINIFF